MYTSLSVGPGCLIAVADPLLGCLLYHCLKSAEFIYPPKKIAFMFLPGYLIPTARLIRAEISSQLSELSSVVYNYNSVTYKPLAKRKHSGE